MGANASNTPEQKKHELYDKQVETLKLFLERHAILYKCDEATG